jgi:pimeloyl-ACP methyl ester carboxylesterase
MTDMTLLFVHGFCCAQGDWAAQVEALSRRFECLALDLPGHGASTPTEPTLIALAQAVNAAKAHARGRRVILVGHSLGCKVVREAYALDRDRVAGIVMIEGAMYDGDRDTLIGRASQAIDAEGFAAYAERHFEAMFVEGSDPAMRARIVERARGMDAGFGRSLYLEAVGWDPLRGRASLRDLEVPVLLIQSTNIDSHFQRRPLQPSARTPFMQAVSELCPQAELQVVGGCGHFPMIEAAAEVNPLLDGFARRVSNGDST